VLPTQTVNDGLVRVSASSGTVGYAGSVTGTGTFEKTGDGGLSFSGTNTWSGPTFVDAGTLAATLPGALSAASAIVLAPGTSLSMSASQTIGALFGTGTVNIDPSIHRP
jgi:fibronectin-binding autotransporter adhesin